MLRRKRVEPGPGQESVWDYPRPPRIEPVAEEVRVVFAGIDIARSNRALRVLETASPPTFYLPSADIRTDLIEPGASRRTYCEWKGRASYIDVVVDDLRAKRAGWFYPEPKRGFESLLDHVAFYAWRVEACFVGDERVRPQGGGFYGGWVTNNIVGPYKGEPGTEGW